MTDTDWPALVASHASSKADMRGWVERYFFVQSGEDRIGRAQDLLDSAAMAADGETASRLQVLRAFFQFAPAGLWGHVVLRPFVVEWACRAACNRGPGALSPPLRGVAMSILGYFVKSSIKGSDSNRGASLSLEAGKETEADAGAAAAEVAAAAVESPMPSHAYAPIAQAVAAMLLGIAEDLPPVDGASTCELPFASTLLLHQCVETLEAAGEAQAPWLAAAADGLDSAARVLQHQCQCQSVIGEQQHLPTQTAVQAQVDAAKAFGMVAEVWMARSAATAAAAGGGKEEEGEEQQINAGEKGAALRALPHGLLSFVTCGLVVHDAFLGAFQSALDVVLAQDGADREAAWALVSTLLQQGLAFVESGVLEGVMDVHRMEMVVGMVGCLVPALRVWAQEGRALTAAEGVISHITALQPRMQAAVQQPRRADEAQALRGALGDLRRGCISVCEAVITSVPMWVCAHRQVYWDLCLRVLRTSALFAAAFCAMRWQAGHAHTLALAAALEGCPVDDADPGLQQGAAEAEVPYADVEILLTHVCTAIQQVERYSDPAAQDVLSCLVNLCECDCKYLVTYPDKHPITAAIVAAYDKSPRGSSARRAGWKVAVLSATKDIFSLHAKHPAGTDAAACPLPQSTRALFLQLVLRDVALLRLALGRNSKEARAAREALGSSESDELHLMLHHHTAALVTFLRIPRCLCADEPSAQASCPALLRSYLQAVYSQPPPGREFEEDLVQACMELETVAHAVAALVAETRVQVDVLPAVRAICLAGGLDAALGSLRAGAGGGGVDMPYETAREALLFIATALQAPGEAKDEGEGEGEGAQGGCADSSLTGALFRALPLSVDGDGQGAAESAADVEALFALKLGL